MPASQPHSALLHITGWPELQGRFLTIGRYVIECQTTPTPPAGRVTVTAYPRTDGTGQITALSTFPSKIRPAKGPNGATFRVTGHLTRLDRHSGEVRLTILPRSHLRPFTVTLHGTTSVLCGLDPSTTYATASGRLLEIAGGYMLAESIQAVHAPRPIRWRGWKPPRFRRKKDTQ